VPEPEALVAPSTVTVAFIKRVYGAEVAKGTRVCERVRAALALLENARVQDPGRGRGVGAWALVDPRDAVTDMNGNRGWAETEILDCDGAARSCPGLGCCSRGRAQVGSARLAATAAGLHNREPQTSSGHMAMVIDHLESD
jgi:hypothetical protein